MYSSVASLHIALDERVQQLNSNRKQSIHAEEYDMALNDAMLAIIKEKCSPILNTRKEGFEDSIKRYDDLESLKKEVPVLLYYDSKGNAKYDLPSDYYHYITSYCEVLYNRLNIPKSYINSNRYISIINFTNVPTNSVGYNVNITLTDGTIITSNNYNNLVRSAKSTFYYFNLIKEYIKSKYDIDCYYENYNGQYYLNSLIIVNSNTAKVVSSITNTQGQSTLPVLTNTVVGISTLVYPQGAYFLNIGVKKIDLVSSINMNNMRNDYYANVNMHLNPYCKIVNNQVTIPTNSQFVPYVPTLEYIKYPRLIDSRINQMSDMKITDEILNKAATNILGILQDKGYQINKQKEQTN